MEGSKFNNILQMIQHYNENGLSVLFSQERGCFKLSVFKAPWKPESKMYVVEGRSVESVFSHLEILASSADTYGCSFDVVSFLNAEEEEDE